MTNIYPPRSLFIIFLLLIFNSAFSQYQTPLDVDPNIKTGRLANGFTYYVRKNTETKHRAVLYLAVKAGSILEEDNQQGLAHFIEHMGFDGTKHYPKNELINYLQKAGVRFGADLNAYTSFDETVYQLPIPIEDTSVLSSGIQIIRDWAQGATLNPDDIEKERGVVLEEKRFRSGVNERINRKTYPLIYNNSRYGKRIPIGTEDVLNNFKPETLTKFYHDWYRPDLEAIIAVGDFDADQMVETIKAKFGDLKNPANEKERSVYNIPLIDDHQYIAVTDKEYHSTFAQILIKDQAIVIKNDRDYFGYILQSVFNICMQNRFRELNNNPDPYFSKATAGIRGYPGGINVYDATVTTTPENLENGLKAIWRQNIRAATFGFTAAEYSKAVTAFYSSKYYAAHQPDKLNSMFYVNQYLQSFLHGGVTLGEQAELKLTQYFLQKMDVNLVNKYCNQLLASGNRDVVIMAPDADKDKLPDMNTVEGWLSEVSREQITNATVAVKTKPQALITKKPEKSKMLSEKQIDGIGVTEVVLSNGVKVALKPNHSSQYDVHFTSVARGGWDKYKMPDLTSAISAVPIITTSGLGDLSQQQLTQFLANHSVAVRPFINRYTQGVAGSCTIKNLETALQLCNQYFTKPRKDTGAFNIYINNLKAASATRTLSDSAKKARNSINLDRAYDIYKERFANAADFTFVFAGDFEVKQMLPLLERYLGSLPSDIQHTFEPPTVQPPAATNNKSRTSYSGIEAKANVTIQYAGDYNYSFEANARLGALSEILKIRLMERLRQQESAIYSTNVSFSTSTIPQSRFTLTINFICAPVNVEKLITSTLDEIDQLKTNGPAELNVEKFKAADKLSVETGIKGNTFWVNYLYSQYLNKQDLNDISNYSAAIEKVTPESIKATASQYLNAANYHRRVVLPESAKK